MSSTDYIHEPATATPAAPLTWAQWRDAYAAEVMSTYEGATREDGERAARCYCTEWLDWHKAAIRAGWNPSQAWINATRDAFPEWWMRRICHDLPDAFDRMANAGLSLYKTKAERDATWQRFA